MKKYGAGKGAWAVVTGASEGIGREYALQLAKKGFNVLVLARNATALNALVSEISADMSFSRINLILSGISHSCYCSCGQECPSSFTCNGLLKAGQRDSVVSVPH